MEKAKSILTGLNPVIDKIMDEVNVRYLNNTTKYNLIISGGSALKYYVRGSAFQMLKQNSLLLSFDHDYKVQEGYEQVFAENLILVLNSIINSTVKNIISYQGFMLLLAIRSTFGNQANFPSQELFSLRLIREKFNKNDNKTIKLYNIFLNIQIDSSNVESIAFIDISTLDSMKINDTMFLKMNNIRYNILTLNNFVIDQIQSLQNSKIRNKTKAVKVLFRIAFLKACSETDLVEKSFVPLRLFNMKNLLKYFDEIKSIQNEKLIAYNQKIFTDISFDGSESLFQTFLHTIKSILKYEETSIIVESILYNNDDISFYEDISNMHKNALIKKKKEIQSVYTYSKTYKAFIIALLYMNVLNDDSMMKRRTDDYGIKLNGFQNYYQWYETLKNAFMICSSVNILHPEFTVYSGLKMFEFPNENFTHFSTSNAPLPFIIPFNTVVSTSISKNIANGFMGTHCCLLQITIPREYTSFIFMGNGLSAYASEHEVLLHPDTLFIVTGREYVYNYDKQKTILVLQGIVQEKNKTYLNNAHNFDPYNMVYNNNNNSFMTARSTFNDYNPHNDQNGGDPVTPDKHKNSRQNNLNSSNSSSNHPIDILFDQINITNANVTSHKVKMLMTDFNQQTKNDKEESSECLPILNCIDLSAFEQDGEQDNEAKTTFLHKYYEKLIQDQSHLSPVQTSTFGPSLSLKKNKITKPSIKTLNVISPGTPKKMNV